LSLKSTAQKKAEPVDFVSYLNLIEDSYGIIFSYADDLVDHIAIFPGSNLQNLKSTLDDLKQKTPFDFVLQGDKNILIVPKFNSQPVCIAVYDEITNDIVLNSILKHKDIIYKPDKSGQFHVLTEHKDIHFTIHAQDYISRQYTITYQNEDCLRLTLSPFYQILDEVLLTNLLTRGIQKIASGGLEINYDEFGLLPGLVEPDVLQSLQALPGITSRRESLSYLNVRGGTHDQNLFLWDGIKMYNTSHFFGMISAFNPYMTKKVSLIKNGTSSKYGDGVSSLINMRTSDSIASQFKAEGGINLINLDAIVEVPLNKNSSVELSSRQSINSLWESPTYNQYFDKVFQNTEVTNFEPTTSSQNDDFNFFDLTLNYKHQITDKDYIKSNFFYAEDDFELNRFDIQRNQLNTRSSQLEQTNIAAGIFYHRDWSKSTKSQVQFYTSRYNQNAFNINLLNQQALEQINEVREIGFRTNIQTRLLQNLWLESGYQFNETGILNSQSINDPGFFRETQNTVTTHSIYSELKYQSPDKRVNLNLGGRLNHFSKFDKYIFEPRFNLSYQFVEDLFLEVLAEQKSQVTSQVVDLQTDFLGVENRRWVLSNLDNRPIIQGQQVSAGLNFIKPNWFINADFFYKKVDGITTQGQGFQNQFQLANTHGSYEVKGMDILVNKSFNLLSGWVSYSLSENNYLFEELTDRKSVV